MAAGATIADVRLAGAEAGVVVEGFTGLDTAADLILLRIPRGFAPALSIATHRPAVGDAVYALGNPEGLEGSISEGIVSAVREFGGRRVLQITAPISSGSSGGPIVNQRGQVVGIASATLTSGQSLNFAVPVSELTALLAMRNVFRPLTNLPVANASPALANDTITVSRIAWHGDRLFFTITNQLTVPIYNIQLRFSLVDDQGYVLDSADVAIASPMELPADYEYLSTQRRIQALYGLALRPRIPIQRSARMTANTYGSERRLTVRILRLDVLPP